MPILYSKTATECGISISALKALYQGEVWPSIGGRLGVPSASIQNYLEGRISPSFSAHLHKTSMRLQRERFVGHRDMAIEVIVAALKDANRTGA